MPEPLAPPTAGGLRWRPITPADARAWYTLNEAVLADLGGGEHLSAQELADELEPAWVDPERDSVLGLDPDGVPRAFGTVELRPGSQTKVRVHLLGGVHPAWCGAGIGRDLLAWQLRRARQLIEQRREEIGDLPAEVMLGIVLRPDGAPQRVERLVARFGGTARRWFPVMQRDLAEPLLAVQPLPAGLRLVPLTADLHEAVRLAHNEAFTGHWGSQPWTAETWQRWEKGHRDFRVDWSFVVLAGSEVAGYTTAAAHTAEWAALGVTEGWTNKLGVRGPWRGKGLGKALLVASMTAFAADGMQAAGLAVDADNGTGAVALYTGLGYRVRERSVVVGFPV